MLITMLSALNAIDSQPNRVLRCRFADIMLGTEHIFVNQDTFQYSTRFLAEYLKLSSFTIPEPFVRIWYASGLAYAITADDRNAARHGQVFDTLPVFILQDGMVTQLDVVNTRIDMHVMLPHSIPIGSDGKLHEGFRLFNDEMYGRGAMFFAAAIHERQGVIFNWTDKEPLDNVADALAVSYTALTSIQDADEIVDVTQFLYGLFKGAGLHQRAQAWLRQQGIASGAESINTALRVVLTNGKMDDLANQIERSG